MTLAAAGERAAGEPAAAAPATRAGGGGPGAARARLAAVAARLVAPLLTLVGLTAVWALAGRLLPAYVPGPLATVSALVDDWRMVRVNASATISGAVRGWLWGNAAALALALLCAFLPRAEGPVLRLSVVVYCLPAMAIGPVLQALLPGNGASVAIAALSVFFTTLLGAVLGLRSAPRAAFDVIRAAGGGPATETVRVRLRAALPSLFAGLRVAAPAAVLGAILGEYLGADKGLGNAIITSQQQLDLPLTWALALVATVVAGAGYVLTGLVGRLLAPWAAEAVDLTPALDDRADPGAAGRRLPARAARAAWTGLASAVVVVALWWGLIKVFGLSPLVAKTPADVWDYLFGAEQAAANRQELLDALGTTLWEAALGFAAGTAVAMLLVTLLALWPTASQALLPTTILLQAVPLTVFTPLMLTMFGSGLAATIVIAAIIVFFPTLVTVLDAVRVTPAPMLDVIRAAGGGRLALLLRAQLPTAVPALFSAARISVPRALIGALVAEWLATGRGVGYLMLRATATYKYHQLWSAVVLTTLVMVLANAGVTGLERASRRRLLGMP
ncbi:MAG: ABC transporter permease subunit [Frankia sp.]|nr:ABC transporter permease subunit [Frankia sp.]